MRQTALVVALTVALCCGLSGQNPVINEVGTLLDYIEICNLDDVTSVDISGWFIVYYEDTQNPGGSIYTFPGVPGSATTVLAPNECLILTDSSTFAHPIVPGGTQMLFFGLNILWNVGEAGSCGLYDDLGNGMDYYAHGNPNVFAAPLEGSSWLPGPPPAGVPTTDWTTVGNGNAIPNWTVPSPNTMDVNSRVSRTDTGGADDWRQVPDPGDTPGVLNHFQYTALATPSGTVPAASFITNTTGGLPGVTVQFTNTSVGDLEWDTGAGSVLWQFDDAPIFSSATTFNAEFTYASAGVYNPTVTMSDSLGAVTVSAPVTITVTLPATVTPVAATPFLEDCEGPILSAPGFAHDQTSLDPANGWEIVLVHANSRVRTAVPNSLAPASLLVPPIEPTPVAGPNVIILDSGLNSNFVTNEVILHFDAVALLLANPAGFQISFWLRGHHDEVHPEDVVVMTDGTTAGTNIVSGGGTSGAPGFGGHQEVMVYDWGAILPNVTWTKHELLIDGSFFTTTGLTPTSDMRLVFRQNDNFAFEGNDGLLIDEVRLGVFGLIMNTTSPTPTTSQADINIRNMTPNSQFITIVTLNPTTVGWFYGIDPNLGDIANALKIPPPLPFMNGTLDANGDNFYSLSLPFPAGALGVTLSGVSILHAGFGQPLTITGADSLDL